jgi:hypothetical protein
MDLSIANSEPFVVFHEFLEQFDRSIKVTHGALALISKMSPNSISNAGNGLVRLPTEDQPWGADTKWRSLDAVVKSSKSFVAQLGLMQIFAAFEDFLTGIRAEYDRFEHATFQKGSIDSVDAQEDDIGLRKLCSHVKIPISSLNAILPIFDYFLLVRNCMAHRSGRANLTLANQSSSQGLLDALDGWQLRPGRKLPEFPQIVQGKQISIQARHTIFAGIVCRALAQPINDHLLAQIGSKGIVFMAAYHSLLLEEPIVKARRKDAEAVVNEVLDGRYRVRMDGPHEALRALKELNRWKECQLRFNRLYSSTAP